LLRRAVDDVPGNHALLDAPGEGGLQFLNRQPLPGVAPLPEPVATGPPPFKPHLVQPLLDVQDFQVFVFQVSELLDGAVAATA
jgi:hypothetical protein